MANSSVRVLLLCKDLGTGAAIGRALGKDFEFRISDDFQTEKWNESQDWCDVVLLDMLKAGNGEEPAFSVTTIQKIRHVSSRVPVIALCNEEDTSFVSQVIEQGAYDTVSNPPNMAECDWCCGERQNCGGLKMNWTDCARWQCPMGGCTNCWAHRPR